MPFYLNSVILKVPADGSPDAPVISTDDQDSSAASAYLSEELKQRFAVVGAQAEVDVAFVMAGLVALLVTVVSVDTAVFAKHMSGRKTAFAASALKHVLGSKVEDRQKRRAETKMGKLMAQELAGSSESLAGLRLALTWQDTDNEEAWLARMVESMESGGLPWTADAQCRVQYACQDGAFSSKATEAGLLRPWMLLASMLPEDRCRIAGELGIEDLADENPGSPAAEAWEMLAKGKNAIGPRIDYAFKTLRRKLVDPELDLPNWTQILLRVLDATHVDVSQEVADLDGNYEASLEASNLRSFDGETATTVGGLEKALLMAVQKKWFEALEEGEARSEVEKAARELNKEHLEEAGLDGLEILAVLLSIGDRMGSSKPALVNHAVEKLKNFGWKQLVKHAVTFVVPELKIPSMVVCITTGLFGSDSLGCEATIVEILTQRLRLLIGGFDIDDPVAMA